MAVGGRQTHHFPIYIYMKTYSYPIGRRDVPLTWRIDFNQEFCGVLIGINRRGPVSCGQSCLGSWILPALGPQTKEQPTVITFLRAAQTTQPSFSSSSWKGQFVARKANPGKNFVFSFISIQYHKWVFRGTFFRFTTYSFSFFLKGFFFPSLSFTDYELWIMNDLWL